MKRFLPLFVFLVMAVPASALMVLQLNLAQLTALSEKVFVGRCVDIQPGKDASGRHIEQVTFDVIETLKGAPETQVTFHQLGLVDGGDDFSPPSDVEVQSLARDLPHYQVGEVAIVFLSAPGETGLTAPVGLGQGKFSVTTTGGTKSVVNGVGNRGLFMGANKSPRVKALSLTRADHKMMRSKGGPLPYDDFVSLVKKLATH